MRSANASLSAWLFVREGGARSLGEGGQLGGSQVGMRASVPLSPALSATASVTSPLGTRAAEASVGVAVRQGNVGVIAERRVRLSGSGRNAFALTAHGGVGDVRVGRNVRIDGYAQAGVVGGDVFGDGALTVERVLHQRSGSVGIGAGVWGGAQPGVARLDVGPSLVARVPLGGRSARLALDWRVRIAGAARPGSGPALTLAADF